MSADGTDVSTNSDALVEGDNVELSEVRESI